MMHAHALAGRDVLEGTRYRALRRIGGGSASQVFEAVTAGGAICAVKVLREVYGNAGETAWRFAQEARLLSKIEHPHVVRVLDVGRTAAGRPFLVMPRLSGETLRQRLERVGSLAPGVACRLLAGALDGLEAAHEAGVVHRDVKPANLFLVRGPSPAGATEERAVVLDFGIAKLDAVTFDPTTDAHIVGTPRYLAPEQVLGAAVDARTDVYAAGLCVYEAIAGRGPFEVGDPFELMRAHLDVVPKRLGSRASVTAALDRVVARALEKPPRARWPTARAFASALRGAR